MPIRPTVSLVSNVDLALCRTRAWVDLDNTCPTVCVSGFPARGQQNYQLATISNISNSSIAGSFRLLSLDYCTIHIALHTQAWSPSSCSHTIPCHCASEFNFLTRLKRCSNLSHAAQLNSTLKFRFLVMTESQLRSWLPALHSASAAAYPLRFLGKVYDTCSCLTQNKGTSGTVTSTVTPGQPRNAQLALPPSGR